MSGEFKWLGAALAAVLLLGGGILIGTAIDGDGMAEHSASEPLRASSIGGVERGRAIFADHGCSACHSFLGKGGSDAPSLDFMRGRLAARDVANMSGRIWNHLPAMEKFFVAEKVPLPTFEEDEMADLIAYLHGGTEPPNVSAVEMKHGGAQSQMDDGSMGR